MSGHGSRECARRRCLLATLDLDLALPDDSAAACGWRESDRAVLWVYVHGRRIWRRAWVGKFTGEHSRRRLGWQPLRASGSRAARVSASSSAALARARAPQRPQPQPHSGTAATRAHTHGRNHLGAPESSSLLLPVTVSDSPTHRALCTPHYLAPSPVRTRASANLRRPQARTRAYRGSHPMCNARAQLEGLGRANGSTSGSPP